MGESSAGGWKTGPASEMEGRLHSRPDPPRSLVSSSDGLTLLPDDLHHPGQAWRPLGASPWAG